MANASVVIEEWGQHQTVPLGMQSQTLGRNASNHIVLKSPYISGSHACFEPSSIGHRLVDTNSTNGLLYGGQRVPQVNLSHGDVVRIGDPTSGNFVTLTYLNPQATLPVKAASTNRFPLTAAVHTIGRVGTDLVLDHPNVTRCHAEVRRQGPGHYVLHDLSSTNGTFVDGRRFSQTLLQVGQIIQIGPYRLNFDGAALVTHNQQGSLRIDGRALERVVRKGTPWHPDKRTILQDVTLSIAPREFVALVGGSGAGKSTLMGTLSGYAPATSGQVLINGDDYYRNFMQYQPLLGFVPQDDIIHRKLSVARALRYAAHLRLPSDTTPAEIDTRIERVLDEVGLTQHRHKLVDSLSGGQRKRVSIGAELLAEPSLFFLDEPTSGLDPGLEKKMMYLLRRLADGGRTIALVTHATTNIEQCDHVAFMSAGRLVFFGPPRAALQFFGAGNDYADIYTRIDGVYDAQDPVHVAQLSAVAAAWQQAHPRATEPPPLPELWETLFKQSPQYNQYVLSRLAAPVSGQSTTPTLGTAAPPRPAQRISSQRQFNVLTGRLLELLWNDRRNLLILLVQAPLIGLLVNVVAAADAFTKDAPGARKVVFVLACVAVWFGIINSAREIAKEAAIFRRERLGGLRLLPYLLSKVTVLAGLSVVQSLVLLLVVGLHVTLPENGITLPVVFELWLSLFLTTGAGVSLGLLVSALARTPDKAMSLVPLILIPQILFAGMIFPLEGGAKLWSWLTISRWSLDALGAVVNLNGLPGLTPQPVVADANYAHSFGHLLGRWAILLVYSMVCLGLTGVLLKRQDQRVG